MRDFPRIIYGDGTGDRVVYDTCPEILDIMAHMHVTKADARRLSFLSPRFQHLLYRNLVSAIRCAKSFRSVMFETLDRGANLQAQKPWWNSSDKFNLDLCGSCEQYYDEDWYTAEQADMLDIPFVHHFTLLFPDGSSREGIPCLCGCGRYLIEGEWYQTGGGKSECKNGLI